MSYLYLALLIAAGTRVAPLVEGIGPARCIGMSVITSEKAPVRPVAEISAREVLDVTFRLLVAGGGTPASDSQLDLTVYGPEGHVYQRMEAPVTADGGMAARVVEGRPVPTRARRMVPSRKGGLFHVDAPPFPVGGTFISSNSLYGTWRVEARMAGVQGVCSASFRIGP